MFTCPKLQRAKGPFYDNSEELQHFLKRLGDLVYFPGTRLREGSFKVSLIIKDYLIRSWGKSCD